eukprot:scaffold127184_cov84-Phaeocystis_antarctica.AAC.3
MRARCAQPRVGLRIEHHHRPHGMLLMAFVSVAAIRGFVQTGTAGHKNLPAHSSGRVHSATMRHAGHLLPTVGLWVVGFDRVHTKAKFAPVFFEVIVVWVMPTDGIDFAVNNCNSVLVAADAHARHKPPRANQRIEHLDRSHRMVVVILLVVTNSGGSTNHVDLAASCGDRKAFASLRHAGQRLPTVGLGVVHVHRVENGVFVVATCCASTHDIDLAIKRHAPEIAATP